MQKTLAKAKTKKRGLGVVIGQKAGPGSAKKAGTFIHQIAFRQIAPSALIGVITAGLPMRELEALRTSLGLPMDQLAEKLGISRATLHRRKAGGKLDPAESDRVVRFARLMGRAIETFESEEYARQWLNAPQFGLGGAVPLDFAATEVGAREVDDLLGRIEYGVYS